MRRHTCGLLIATILFLSILGFHNFALAGDITVTSEGKVGINTSTPTSELSVNGVITAKELLVTDAGWADYVFKPGYELLDLDSVAEYIRQNNHLPGIPSGREIQAGGIPVSKLITLQMSKIEELTLHLIEMKKENESLKSRVAQLEKKQ
jgi:hypothetical protein